MATNANTTPVAKTPKAAKPAAAPVQRVTEILKRAALQKKVTAEELEQVSALANALKTFMAA